MTHYAAMRVVQHSADRMLDLVADVESYPAFVPMCRALVVRERKIDGDVQELLADMTVGQPGMEQTFGSRVRIDRGGRTVTARNVDGPFKVLATEWRFEPLTSTSCNVRFEIEYQFASPILAALAGKAMGKAFERFADAFAARADEVYSR